MVSLVKDPISAENADFNESYLWVDGGVSL